MRRSRRAVGAWGCRAVLALGLVGIPLRAAAPPAHVQTEYERRFAQLKPDDLPGHLQLAFWCKDQEAWELLRKECTLILARTPDHPEAKLLLELAVRNLSPATKAAPAASESERTPASGPAGGLPRRVTDDEIRRIRWREMMDQEPKPLSIQFKNQVLPRFLQAMEGKAGFTTRDERSAFLRRTPTEKVHIIRKHTGDRFADDIVIKTDPKRMAEFERRVLPVVLSGCATAHCHGDPKKTPFTLYSERLLSKNKVYANYLNLHRYQVGGKRVISRDAPLKSLLLTYGFLELPPGLDPSYKHPVELSPIYRNVEDPKYQAVRQWLESLSVLEPDYGIGGDG